MTTNEPETLLSASYVAKWLGMSDNGLARMRMAGRGPKFVRVGQRPRYRRSDVEAWMDQGGDQ